MQVWVIIGNMIWCAKITSHVLFMNVKNVSSSIIHIISASWVVGNMVYVWNFEFYIACKADIYFYFFFLYQFFVDGTKDAIIQFIHSIFFLFIFFFKFCVQSLHDCHISHQMTFFSIIFLFFFFLLFLFSDILGQLTYDHIHHT